MFKLANIEYSDYLFELKNLYRKDLRRRISAASFCNVLAGDHTGSFQLIDAAGLN